MDFLLAMLNKEIDLRRDDKMPLSYQQAKNFKPEIYTSAARFVIDERYLQLDPGAIPGQTDSKAQFV